MAFIYDNTNSTTTGGVFNAADTIIVNAEAFVLNFSADGLQLNNAPYIVKVNGQVGSVSGPGINFANSTGVSTLTVGVTGDVFGSTHAVTANHAVNVTNSGTLFSGSDALELKGNGNYTVLNKASGSILSRSSDAIFINGTGTHTIINNGEMAIESIFFAIETSGTGIEIVTNTGKMTGDIFLDLGNDSFTNLGKGVVLGNIHLGGGNDKFVGNSTGEHVFDSSDSDKVSLGGGGDIYTALRSNLDLGADGNDTVNGGKGADIYDAIGSNENLRINLAGISFTDPLNSITVQANTATDLGAGESGTDKVFNFENVATGNGSDIVYGNALANQISTGFGFDHLFGLGGNDRLDGGDQDDDLFGGSGNDALFGGGGADNITGGTGKDTMFGGDGSTADGSADIFIFTGLGDSTPGLTTRDVIMDYEDGTDIIDLAAIGMTDFIGTDVVFGSVAGQVRAVTTGQGWVLQGDRNGDGKVDFALEVRDTTHAITWADANFDFIP